MRSIRYTYREPGVLRMNIAGMRIRLVDSRKHFTCYTVRTHGWKVGPFYIVVERE